MISEAERPSIPSKWLVWRMGAGAAEVIKAGLIEVTAGEGKRPVQAWLISSNVRPAGSGRKSNAIKEMGIATSATEIAGPCAWKRSYQTPSSPNETPPAKISTV